MVCGPSGGGILFDQVTFDADANPGNGYQQVPFTGTLDIGSVPPSTISRVTGDGLSLINPTGDLSIETLNIANVNGTGLEIDGLGSTFNMTINGGTIDTVGGQGIRATNFTGATIRDTTVTGGDGEDAVTVIINEDGLNSVITSLNNIWTARSGNANGVTISTAGTAELCLHAVGNGNNGSGTGFGLELNQSGSSVLGITQASFLEFASDNPLTDSLNPVGTIGFGCVIPEPELISPGPSAPAEGETGPGVSINIGLLPAGKAVGISFQASINDPFPGGVTQVANQGIVSGNNFDELVTDDPDTSALGDPTITPIEVVVTPMADLSLHKLVDKSTAKPDETITFTLTLNNIGPDGATGIQVADAIPAGLTDVVVTPSGTTTYTGGVWSVNSLAASGVETLAITGVVVANGTSITNTAEVTASDQADPVASNNAASASVTIAELVADLSLDKQADMTTAMPGETVTFTVTLTNIGPDGATGVQVSDAIPAGLTDVVVTPSGATTYAGGVWTVNSLAASTFETLTISGEVVANGSTIINTAEVTAADQADPDSTNNAASASVTVVLPQVNADLSLSKSVDNDRPNVGDEVNFTVTINNQGPDRATGVNVTDLLPTGLTFVESSLQSYDPGSGVWTVGSLAVEQTRTLMITAQVTAAGPASNIASVTASDQPDPDSSDNQAAVTVTPQVADLSLVKTVDDLSTSVGGDVTFTIAVHNAGPDAATGVTVTDSLPAGLEFIRCDRTRKL